MEHSATAACAAVELVPAGLLRAAMFLLVEANGQKGGELPAACDGMAKCF